VPSSWPSRSQGGSADLCLVSLPAKVEVGRGGEGSFGRSGRVAGSRLATRAGIGLSLAGVAALWRRRDGPVAKLTCEFTNAFLLSRTATLPPTKEALGTSRYVTFTIRERKILSRRTERIVSRSDSRPQQQSRPLSYVLHNVRWMHMVAQRCGPEWRKRWNTSWWWRRSLDWVPVLLKHDAAP
jgi:hypothetical protein